jgi:hypothetical protein
MSGLDAARVRLAENGPRTGGKWAFGAALHLPVSLLPLPEEAAGAFVAEAAAHVSLRDVGNGLLYGSNAAAASLGLFFAAPPVVEILSSLLESYALGAEHTRHLSAVDVSFSRVQTRHVQSTASRGDLDLPSFFCRAAVALDPHSHDLKGDSGKEAFVFSLGGARLAAGTAVAAVAVVAG